MLDMLYTEYCLNIQHFGETIRVGQPIIGNNSSTRDNSAVKRTGCARSATPYLCCSLGPCPDEQKTGRRGLPGLIVGTSTPVIFVVAPLLTTFAGRTRIDAAGECAIFSGRYSALLLSLHRVLISNDHAGSSCSPRHTTLLNLQKGLSAQ